MRKTIAALALMGILNADYAMAQNQQQKAGIEDVADNKFKLLSAGMVGSTTFDLETTIRAIENNPNLYEANPIMRPFVENGRAPAYLFSQGINAGLIYFSYRAKKSGKKYWWIIPLAGITAHTIAGINNLNK